MEDDTLDIVLLFFLDRRTGKGCTFDETCKKKDLDTNNLAGFEVPEKYKRFIHLEGQFVKCYQMDNLTLFNHPEYVLNTYPEWSSIKDKVGKKWSEADHIEFREALEWFNSRRSYVIIYGAETPF